MVQLLASVECFGPPYGPATGEAEDGEASAQVAFEWRDWPDEPRVIGYCNLDAVQGTHIDGFRRGLADALGREDYALVYEALSRGLNAVVSVLLLDPEHKAPTWSAVASSKEACVFDREVTKRAYENAHSTIASKEARSVAREATKRAFKSALETNPELRAYIAKRLK